MPHALPHLPQLSGSLARSAQPLAHAISPPAQLHAPSTQVVPLPHAVPQAPQSWSSEVTSTQPPLQSVRPVGHPPVVHMPSAHTLPDGQATLQPPQLSGSLVSSRHAPLQSVSPAPHDAAQAPAEHTWAPQSVPHAPQLCGSDERSAHPEAHELSAPEQALASGEV